MPQKRDATAEAALADYRQRKAADEFLASILPVPTPGEKERPDPGAFGGFLEYLVGSPTPFTSAGRIIGETFEDPVGAIKGLGRIGQAVTFEIRDYLRAVLPMNESDVHFGREFWARRRAEAFPEPPAGIAEEIGKRIDIGLPIPLGIGEIGKDISEGRFATGVGRTLGLGLGFFGPQTLKVLGKIPVPKLPGKKFRRPPPVPEEVIRYLEDANIPLSAGERASPGFVSTVEPITAKTASGRGTAVTFLEERQIAIKARADKLADRVGEAVVTPEGTPVAAREVVGREIQNIAENLKEISARLEDIFHDDLGAAVTKFNRAEQANVGEIIIKTVRGQHAAIDAAENVIYDAVKDQVAALGGIKVTWTSARDFATESYTYAQRAEAAGASPYTSKVMDILRKVGGQTKKPPTTFFQGKELTLGEVLRLRPSHQVFLADEIARMRSSLEVADDFAVMTGTRTGARQIRQELERARIQSPSIGVLKHLESLMLDDLQRSLPPDLAATWKAARELTFKQKEMFNSNFLKSMMRQENPLAASQVVRALMTKGKASDAKALLRVLGNDVEAVTKLQRATIDFIMDTPAITPEKALNYARNHQSVRQILGKEKHKELIKRLESRMAFDKTPAQASYTSWLSSTAKGKEPALLTRRALKSPDAATQLNRATKGNPRLRSRIARDMFDSLLDQATGGGPYSAPGTNFNPVEFAKLFRESEQAFRKFLPGETVKNLRQFADGMKALKLSAQIQKGESISAAFHALTLVSGGGAAVVSALIGTPLEMVASASSVALGAHMAPKVWLKVALSPRGSRLLAEGVTLPSIPSIPIPPGVKRAAPWMVRFNILVQRAAEELLEEEDTPIDLTSLLPQRRRGWGMDPTKVMLEAKQGNLTPGEADRLIPPPQRRLTRYPPAGVP